MKQKEPTIQGSFGEILQPDVVSRYRIWTCAAVQLAVLIPLVFWSIQGDDPVLWGFCALTAVVFALYQGKLVLVSRRNRSLAFCVTPEKLTVLWVGQPVKTVPWDDVIEIFMICGPCEWHGKYAAENRGVPERGAGSEAQREKTIRRRTWACPGYAVFSPTVRKIVQHCQN